MTAEDRWWVIYDAAMADGLEDDVAARKADDEMREVGETPVQPGARPEDVAS